MDRVKLPARARNDMSKRWLKELRRTGFIPASLNEKSGSIPLEITLHDLVEAAKTDAGSHALLEVQVEGNKKASGAAMIKNVQRDPITRRILHVDLQRVSLTEKITSPVPIEIVGDAKGLKDGGTIDQVLIEVEVRALATDLPPRIEIDATQWEIGQVIRTADLALPAGLELVTDPDSVVATLRPPHVHLEAAVEAPATAAEAAMVKAGEGETSETEG